MGAVLDELKFREAMLSAGIGDNKDPSELSARQITAVLLGLAHASPSIAA